MLFISRLEQAIELQKFITKEKIFLDLFFFFYFYGIYFYDGEDIIDVQWYKSEEERESELDSHEDYFIERIEDD